MVNDMKQYARMVDGKPFELIDAMYDADGVEIPLDQRFPPFMLATIVEWGEDKPLPPAEGDQSVKQPVTEVTMRQARLALIDAGHYEAVNDAIHDMTGVDGLKAQVEWDFARTVERASPIVGMLAGMLALDDEALDNLFDAAAKL